MKSIKVLGFEYPDPLTHDTQHWWASVAGMIAGVAIFVTYYFFTRAESEASQNHHEGAQVAGARPWKMPWYYFVVGIVLSAFSMSSIACVLSTANRPREIHIMKM